MGDRRAWVAELLSAVEIERPVRSVAVLARILQREFQAVDVSFLITDLGGKAVVRLTGDNVASGDGPKPLALAGTVYGHVVRSQRPWIGSLEFEAVDAMGVLSHGPAQQSEPHSGLTKVIAPVTHRGDAIGLLELTLPEPPDRAQLDHMTEAAHALAYVVIVNRRFTDLYEWGRRTTPMSLASEIQHQLLPESYTCEAGPVTLAGSLEPAAQVGGDTFDYALGENGITVSLTDAMGHDVRAAQLATVVVAALRNARRTGQGLIDQARAANQAVVEHAVQEHDAVTEQTEQVRGALAEHGAQAMVTGQLMWIGFDTGENAFVNAGHQFPLRLRDGRAEQLTPLVDIPFGILPESGYRLQSLDLRPGDRLLLLTDGMLEPTQEDRSLRRLLEATASEHPREAVQAFTRSVLADQGHDPRDDATALCLDFKNSS
ncbi:PP2C family protein-serine/threonine phosphatase [Streptomyces marispadix]|uniref:Serine/threonine-protein phosphatase n=1 Tax=Streptomyces marispadix TaxID=2922868 RepID=A0ABS9T4F7_9ACTN|nr:PP2C family protein-serine/threonine phosphatase [Streptomyces marispadix]MCH6163390.1 serine/threonine-protein phosphatase [Streptomyces marispadix]